MRFGFVLVMVMPSLALPAMADEGMWLFNQFPKDQVKQRYSFDVTDSFLEHLRLSTLRVGGGSGSFVSPNGLILTNHHLVAECISKMASAARDSLKDGLYAASAAEEVRCPGLDAEVLLSLEDVTKQVKEENRPGVKAAEVLQKRNAAIARLEKGCSDQTGNHCVVVKLFSGERYDLYQYRKYADLRLVFAPELGIAFFGGDAEHSTYQRYDMDIAFLRAYDHGRPASTPHFLKWSAEGVKESDLVFSTGNPGATSRLSTAAQLIFYRDYWLPISLARLQTRIEALRIFASRNAGNRQSSERLLSEFGNAYKKTAGKLIGLAVMPLLPSDPPQFKPKMSSLAGTACRLSELTLGNISATSFTPASTVFAVPPRSCMTSTGG